MSPSHSQSAPGGGFTFRKLDVYRCMLEYLKLEHEATRRFPAGYAWLRDQLDRAADSMILNFGEGAGKRARSKDRNRYWDTSLGSASESASAWDVARIRQLSPASVTDRALDLLDRISAMLRAMKR